MPEESIEDPIWRKCEIAWSSYLEGKGYMVTRLCDAIGNTPGTNAPMIRIQGYSYRAPDIETKRGGKSEYWEIKYRSRADRDPLSGASVYWISYEALQDYLKVARASGSTFWIVVYEGPTALRKGRWLRIKLAQARIKGVRAERVGADGKMVKAWVWPVSAMEVVNGPSVPTGVQQLPVIHNDTRLAPPISDLELFERELRENPVDEPEESESPRRVLVHDSMAALDVLRQSLGIPHLPRYSVLRVCAPDENLSEILGLLHYGIRVFLISNSSSEPDFDPGELAAFQESRLLERAFVSDLRCDPCWIVDGVVPSTAPPELQVAMDQAGSSGGINIEQYRIVHAGADSSVLVTAGAGTGKTETMSERLVFLLATAQLSGGADSPHVYDLALSEVALITFTRESAREMRRRIALTLSLRQRLSRRCVLPIVAWLMQLSHARISTIHMFAKSIIQEYGGAIGLSPDFSVSSQTLAFRELLHNELTTHAEPLIRRAQIDVMAAHLWQEHIQALWDALENNGVPHLTFAARHIPSNVEWPRSGRTGFDAEVEAACAPIIEGLRESFSAVCEERQAVPTGQLVPCALASLTATEATQGKSLRYLFVDEFQDTDGLQMDLILAVQRRLQARLFVVGDAKQGIYRFRGAEGNAFVELRRRVAEGGFPSLAEFSLTRNFRTGQHLLESLHPFFLSWGRSDQLPYGPEDQLRYDINKTGQGVAIELRNTNGMGDAFVDAAADQVERWRELHPESTIAVLCRRNTHAIKVQRRIRERGGRCELLVGGSFYRTPAVRELRVFLEAIANPDDDAALLELCESRWAGRLMQVTQPPEGIEDPDGLWEKPLARLLSWRDRLAHVSVDGSFAREDLEPVRIRVRMITGMLARMSALSCIVECIRALAPEACSTRQDDDETERRRYGRCLNHLITLVDAHFAESPATLYAILTWLEIQIASNHNEDEPMDAEDMEGRTTALTVHKSKGLEFDFVIVPNTWTGFGPPDTIRTRTAVLQADGGKQVLWQWRGGTAPPERSDRFTNVANGNQWRIDDVETAREETRLLYVAMTRARSELVMLRPGWPRPATWSQLLADGEAARGHH